MENPKQDPKDVPLNIIKARSGFDEIAAKTRNKMERENARRKKRESRGLTQRIVDRAKPEEKEYRIPDDLKTFGLRVRPSGHKTYELTYKTRGKEFRRFKIGDATVMSLKEASAKALELRSDILEGIDPQGDRKTHESFTLDVFFRSYVKDRVRPDLSKSWGGEIERIYLNYVQKYLGSLPVAGITRKDLMRCAQSGSTEHVRQKIRAVLSALYTWGTEMGEIDGNILKGSRSFLKPNSRDRVLSDHELWAAWSATSKLNSPWGEYFRFLILTGQRRSEVAAIHWREVDLEQLVWHIPGERMKNRDNHSVPITPAMHEFLSTAENQKGYLFQSTRESNQPISGFSKAVKRWKEEANFDGWRLHDLRRTVATNLGKIGIAPHVIEAVIGHRSGTISDIAKVYNRHQYEVEKLDALTRWHEYLFEVLAQDFKPIVRPEDDIML